MPDSDLYVADLQEADEKDQDARERRDRQMEMADREIESVEWTTEKTRRLYREVGQ